MFIKFIYLIIIILYYFFDHFFLNFILRDYTIELYVRYPLFICKIIMLILNKGKKFW
jgi:hypothetical protein